MSETGDRAVLTDETSEQRSWVWGGHAPLGLALALSTLVIDQAHKW